MEMREILFRGKRLDNGKWIEGYYAEFKQLPNSCIYHVYKGHTLVDDVDPKTVCQYTGLTDKNGRKIFEGDIVKYHFGEDVAPVRFGSYQSCFDSQQTEHCGFYVDWKENRNLRKDLGYWVHMVDAEIVGNIHDNPELIGADKQR